MINQWVETLASHQSYVSWAPQGSIKPAGSAMTHHYSWYPTDANSYNRGTSVHMYTYTTRFPPEESGLLAVVEVWTPPKLSKALNLTLLWPTSLRQWFPPCFLPSLTFAKFSLLSSELAARWSDPSKSGTCWCTSGIPRWNWASEKLAPPP